MPKRTMTQVLDLVSAADRRYFEAHPNATVYYRVYVDLEFGPGFLDAVRATGYLSPGAVIVVEVTKVTPDLRLRRPSCIAIPPRGGVARVYQEASCA
jgi:hypothetical protein